MDRLPSLFQAPVFAEKPVHCLLMVLWPVWILVDQYYLLSPVGWCGKYWDGFDCTPYGSSAFRSLCSYAQCRGNQSRLLSPLESLSCPCAFSPPVVDSVPVGDLESNTHKCWCSFQMKYLKQVRISGVFHFESFNGGNGGGKAFSFKLWLWLWFHPANIFVHCDRLCVQQLGQTQLVWKFWNYCPHGCGHIQPSHTLHILHCIPTFPQKQCISLKSFDIFRFDNLPARTFSMYCILYCRDLMYDLMILFISLEET